MKIKKGRCRCGADVHLVEEAGLSWAADTKPLKAQEAVRMLIAGRDLYRITRLGGTYLNLAPATPAVLAALRTEPGERPEVVASHICPAGAVRPAEALPAVPVVRGSSRAPCGPSDPVLGRPGGVCGRCGDPGF